MTEGRGAASGPCPVSSSRIISAAASGSTEKAAMVSSIAVQPTW